MGRLQSPKLSGRYVRHISQSYSSISSGLHNFADCRTIGPRNALRLAEKTNRKISKITKRKKMRKYFCTCTQCGIKQIVELYDNKYLNDGDRSSRSCL